MKQLFRFWIVAALLLMVGCSKEYDDSALVGRVDDLESRVQRLEQLCQQMNTNISSLQTIVTALQNNDYVTGVTPITENGKTIGYTITFAKAQSITIYHGKDGQNGADGKDGQDGADGKDGQDGADGKDGADGAPGKDGENGKDGADGKDGKDGKDGYTPIIGVKQDTDGIYYWTLDGEWLLDDAGNKIKAVGTDGKDGADGQPGQNGATGPQGPQGEQGPQGASGKDGITPMLKIENDYWYISYDNGETWTLLGKATGDDGQDGQNGTDGVDGKDGDSFFQSITQDESNVYFTLADGTVITIPKGLALSVEFAESDLVVMSPNSTREIGYTVTSATETVKVEVTSSADIKAKAVTDNASGLTGKIHITTGDAIDEYSKVIVFVSNGDKVIMRSITFEEAGLVVEENATKQATAEGGEMTLEFLSNVECEVVIPEEAQDWISVVPATRALTKQTITLKLEPNEGATRSVEVIVKSVDGKLSLTYTITQEPASDYQLALEREALIAIYNALDGDNWENNENWCSDKPVSEWYGIGVAENGSVSNISLSENNLSGVLPEEIGDLTRLKTLYLGYNHIAGSIPFSLCELENLEYLHLQYNSLTGSIPDKLADLFIRSSSKYWAIDLSSNRLSGVIPKGVAQSEYFRYMFGQIMVGNDLILDTKIKAPVFSTTDIQGNLINDDIYSENKLTLLIHGTQSYVEPMIELYQEYHPKGLEIISYDYNSYIGSENELRQWYNDKNIPWRCFYSKNAFGSMNEHSDYPALIFGGAITLVDQNGIVLGSSHINGAESCLNIIKKELQNDNSTYFSTDYSLDRVVTVLQQAKEGNGIEVVLMGDGYSDRQVADGTYLADMKLIYKYLFNIEPYSSFKDLFTVKVLNVISLTEGYDTGYTPALETRIFPESASVGFHDMSNVYSAAESVLTDPNRGTTIVLANSTVYAGTCFWGYNIYYPMDIDGDGSSICCITKPNEATLEQLIHHEACGHGFAKLADEYAYEENGAISADDVNLTKEQQYNWGWWKNVDFTNDLSTIRWNYFINDSRYANEGLGAYEGGLTYWTGVWRPTENSIMRYNTGGFNAPSREAIYYRIHKLAYGDSWEYDFEKFVEWDARNRTTAATRAMVYKPANYKPTHPPVIVKKSWKDAK